MRKNVFGQNTSKSMWNNLIPLNHVPCCRTPLETLLGDSVCLEWKPMSNLCVTVTHVMATTSNSPSSASWHKEFTLLNS